MVNQRTVPAYHELFNSTLIALHKLGGSGSISEIVDQIIADLQIPDQVIETPHGRGNQTELEYRLAWSRTYLKKFGLLDNSARGVWSLTTGGLKREEVDPRKIIAFVQRQGPERKIRRPEAEVPDTSALTPEESEQTETASWRQQLIDALLDLPPDSFERLCQRLLRESGFIEVEVTGRSGDGGIDGRGILRMAGLISFNVLFQSKRYRGSLGPNIVRDFRGAMVGRADKGLIITTGMFTRDARKEATRDGAPAIDLIDGTLLTERLKELKLGVRTQQVEAVEINREWLAGL